MRLPLRQAVGGYSDGTFRPATPVTRGQLSKFISNAAEYSDAIPADRQTFTDVPSSNVFWLAIERAYAHEVIGSYTDGAHCPGGVPCFQPAAAVTRGQTAQFVAGAAGYVDPIPATQQTFADVPPSNVFWGAIERVALQGVVGLRVRQPGAMPWPLLPTRRLGHPGPDGQVHQQRLLSRLSDSASSLGVHGGHVISITTGFQYHGRTYQGRKFDENGRPVRDIDFTSPTYGNVGLGA
ncbi:MAG: S-layer homology domain-containing protein [Chloroflexota bacterium]|nr:S-layer homology domain-containing protein [Chloroflexota bacterium]